MRKITLKLEGHADDINAVCFADPISTNVLFSGSDDSVVKVWDRRSMAGGREAGCLVGHMEGITFVSSKGDGRYVITNGKDQTLKLWDIRMMVERGEFDKIVRKDYNSGFDYRWMVPTLPLCPFFLLFASFWLSLCILLPPLRYTH
jgi:DDB1- and CUL4-associated factor 11